MGAPGLRFLDSTILPLLLMILSSSDVNELSSLISSTSNSITSNTLVAYDFSEGRGTR